MWQITLFGQAFSSLETCQILPLGKQLNPLNFFKIIEYFKTYTKLSPNLNKDQPMDNPISFVSITTVTYTNTHFMWQQIPDIIYFIYK